MECKSQLELEGRIRFIHFCFVFVSLQIWFKNRRAKFRKKKRTCCLQFNKEKNEDDTNNTIPVSPVCWPPLFPTLAPRGTTPSETQQLSGEKVLPVSSSYCHFLEEDVTETYTFHGKQNFTF